MVIKETEMNQIQDYIKSGNKRHSMVLNEFNNLKSTNNILPNISMQMTKNSNKYFSF